MFDDFDRGFAESSFHRLLAAYGLQRYRLLSNRRGREELGPGKLEISHLNQHVKKV